MKRDKSKKAAKNNAKNNAKNSNQTPPRDDKPSSDGGSSRRDFLSNLKVYGLGGAVGAGILWWVGSDVVASIVEQDLSKIGNGIPAIVQIHDPNCQLCQALQRETKDAMKAFDDSELQFLVADINGDPGRDLANAHGVGHVTLLLFDGHGKRLSILAGSNTSDNLEIAFRNHLNTIKKNL